jgi:hypothetical protein
MPWKQENKRIFEPYAAGSPLDAACRAVCSWDHAARRLKRSVAIVPGAGARSQLASLIL